MITQIITNRANVQKRFVSFFIVGFLTLSAELSFTAFLLYVIAMPATFAIGLSFLTSLVASYFIFRKYTFYGTQRKHASGFAYFSIIAISGLIISMGGAELAIVYWGVNPLVARFFLAGATGMVNFLINLVYNFKVADVH